MRAFGTVIVIVIAAALGYAAFLTWGGTLQTQTSTDGIQQLRDVQQKEATQIADLQKQLQDVQNRLANSAKQDNAGDLSSLKSQLSAEQGERKLLSEQLGSLTARVDSLTKSSAAEPQPVQQTPKRLRRP
jgi:TolA-binding protein